MLNFWLKEVPQYTVIFLRLTIIVSMMNMLGNTSYTACMATGKLKRYVIVISIVGFLIFPLTWIAVFVRRIEFLKVNLSLHNHDYHRI